jgi:hypothetical protein
MPIFLIFLIGGGIGTGGFFYGRDQHKKRVKDRDAFQRRIAELEKELKELKERLGTKNEQVRTLASIIQKMKQEQGLAA